MKKELFTIVITVYNQESFISECINSIIKQTFTNWEAIIIDDGSTDASFNICKRLEKNDQRIKVFSQKNSGVVNARKNGVLQSKGDYVLYLDADDSLKKNTLELLYREFQTNNVDLIYYDFKKNTNNNITDCENDKVIFHGDSKFLAYAELLKNNINGIARCGRRELFFKELIFCNNNVKEYEDLVESYTLFYYAKKIEHLCEKLYIYRENQNSITHSFYPTLFEDVKYAATIGEKFVRDLDDITDKQREYLLTVADAQAGFYMYAVIMRVMRSNLSWKDCNSYIKKIQDSDFYKDNYKKISSKSIVKMVVYCVINSRFNFLIYLLRKVI